MPESASGPWQVTGPLAGRFTVHQGESKHDRNRLGPKTGTKDMETANARLILHRTAIFAGADFRELDDAPIRTWALDTDLGQRDNNDRNAKLRHAVGRRRAAALRRLAAQPRLAGAPQVKVRAIEVEAQGAMVTGTGDAGIRNVGITLHGTYGWPVLPGSTLKGVAHAYARDVAAADEAELARLFGAPRPGSRDEAAQGPVAFIDALPGWDGVSIAEHVLTPHTRDYQGQRTAQDGRPVPPAEYFNPVPIPFLVAERGAFIVHLLGPAPQVDQVADLLKAAVDDIGVGAKTSAGYGYLTATDAADPPPEPPADTEQAPAGSPAARKKGKRR